MTVGQRIRQRRQELGLSQTELGLRLGGISRAAVSSAELDRKDMTTDRIRRYAEALETTPAYLMGWEATEEQNHALLLNAYYQRIMKMSITDDEMDVIVSYRAASDEVKGVINKILGVIPNES